MFIIQRIDGFWEVAHNEIKLSLNIIKISGEFFPLFSVECVFLQKVQKTTGRKLEKIEAITNRSGLQWIL